MRFRRPLAPSPPSNSLLLSLSASLSRYPVFHPHHRLLTCPHHISPNLSARARRLTPTRNSNTLLELLYTYTFPYQRCIVGASGSIAPLRLTTNLSRARATLPPYGVAAGMNVVGWKECSIVAARWLAPIRGRQLARSVHALSRMMEERHFRPEVTTLLLLSSDRRSFVAVDRWLDNALEQVAEKGYFFWERKEEKRERGKFEGCFYIWRENFFFFVWYRVSRYQGYVRRNLVGFFRDLGVEFSWASFRGLYFASSLSLSEISMKTFV